MGSSRVAVFLGVVGMVAGLLVSSAGVAVAGPVSGFNDVPDDDVFASDIAWLKDSGITKGCNPPTNDLFCPDATVTRGQFAAFLVRALGLTDVGDGDLFVDDDGSVFEVDIDRLATAGITKGCNPPTNDMFCPEQTLTRGQLAAFLRRAFDTGSDPVPFNCSSVTSIPTTECEALDALYRSTNGAAWDNNTGWLVESSDPCTWFGVGCLGAGDTVTNLDVSNNSLSGLIPPELGNLSNLDSLWLGINSLSGSIPPELGNLSSLTTLSLTLNSLSGSIPTELANLTNLKFLFLNANGLSGGIPPELGALPNLQTLLLNVNALSGPIPPELGSLGSLVSLLLSGNSLTGSLPPELGNLSNLATLALGSNMLSGEIPGAVYTGLDSSQGGSLTFLALSQNGCLTVPSIEPPGMTAWLHGLDPLWDSGC
ncbi:MAG: S-layer homology domain-containing protein [Actinomycetota bacterium]|nr:S-layer homology domain-containing protein [Actinomycetota bacterium]